MNFRRARRGRAQRCCGGADGRSGVAGELAAPRAGSPARVRALGGGRWGGRRRPIRRVGRALRRVCARGRRGRGRKNRGRSWRGAAARRWRAGRACRRSRRLPRHPPCADCHVTRHVTSRHACARRRRRGSAQRRVGRNGIEDEAAHAAVDGAVVGAVEWQGLEFTCVAPPEAARAKNLALAPVTARFHL